LRNYFKGSVGKIKELSWIPHIMKNILDIIIIFTHF
jgi:hypothetical protein